MPARFLRHPRWILVLVLVSVVPLLTLTLYANQSRLSAHEQKRASDVRTAAYAGELARNLVERELRDYFRPRQEMLTYAHLKGEDAFRGKLKSIYYTSKLMDMPQFVSEEELRRRIREPGPDLTASHLEAHRAAEERSRRAPYLMVAAATETALVTEAAQRMGYDETSGSFVHATLVDAHAEDLETSFQWISVDVAGPDGKPCEGCVPYLQKVGRPEGPTRYSVFVVSFPLPGREGIDTGMFGAIVPAKDLVREILAPAIAGWDRTWESTRASSAAVAKEGLTSPMRIRLVDRSGEAVVTTAVDEATSPLRESIYALPLLGQGSPFSLEVFMRNHPTTDSGLWNVGLVLAILVLVLGLGLMSRSFMDQVENFRLRSHLLSNISHELKTPLSLIRLYTDTLEAGRVTSDADRRKFLGIIGRESKRLTHLIDNILDIQRIEQDRKSYSYAQVRPDKVVRDTVEAYRYQLTEEGFELRLDVDDDLPLLMLDEEAVAQALINLLDNAAKYSDTVKEIRVRCTRKGDEVRISVQDRGIGIPEREQKKIFQTFYRVEKSLVHNIKGSGLGLPVVAHVARAHGGRTEVDSTPGKGSTFTLCLPLSFDPDSV